MRSPYMMAIYNYKFKKPKHEIYPFLETWFRSPDILANSTHENGLAKVIDLDKPLTWGSSLETEGRICYKSDAESADAKNNCGKCAKVVLGKYVARNGTAMDFLNDYKTMAGDFGSTELDRTKSRLSCHRTEQMWFDVMRSYGGLGTFLSVFSLFSIVLYFVTSSDSGSLVIDCLTSNGDPDPPKIQRVFWALMEGATATALLVAGGKDALDALQVSNTRFYELYSAEQINILLIKNLFFPFFRLLEL